VALGVCTIPNASNAIYFFAAHSEIFIVDQGEWNCLCSYWKNRWRVAKGAVADYLQNPTKSQHSHGLFATTLPFVAVQTNHRIHSCIEYIHW
jgi:hypothetical protein